MREAAKARADRPILGWLSAIGLAGAWLSPLVVTWQTAPDLGHSWAVPFLMAYLWWERWDERPVALSRTEVGTHWWAVAVAIGLIAIPLRLLLTPFPVWPQVLLLFSALLCATLLAASWLVAGRAGVRWTAGPLLLVVTTLPVPTALETSIILPLRAGMAALAADISNLLGQPAIASGTSIQLARSWVGIDEACGGIRSLQACLMIGLFFGEWYRFSWTKRIGLIVLAILAALLGNFGRVLFLAFQASGGAKAIEAAHDPAGWLAMGASLALTGLFAWRWAGYRMPQQRPSPRRDVMGGLAAWHWASVVALLFVLTDLGTRGWYARGAANLPKVQQWSAHLPENLPTFKNEPLPDYAREVLRPDLYVAGSWIIPNVGPAAAYYVEWHRGQAARSAPFDHNPTVCLPMSGCELVEALPPLIVPWAGGELPFRAYRFRRAGQELLVAFIIWDPVHAKPLTTEQVAHSRSEWWQLQWREVREARKDQSAQLLAISIPWTSETTETAHQFLREMITSLPF